MASTKNARKKSSGFKFLPKQKGYGKKAGQRAIQSGLASGGGLAGAAITKAVRGMKNGTISKYAGSLGWATSVVGYMAVENEFTDAFFLGMMGSTAVQGTGEVFPDAKPALGLAGVGANDPLTMTPDESAAYQRAMAQLNNALDNEDSMNGADIDTSLLEGADVDTSLLEGADEDFDMAEVEYDYA